MTTFSLRKPSQTTSGPAAKPSFTAVEDPVLTPAEVLEHIRVPKEQFRIQGVVSRAVLNKYKTKVYGDIKYGDGMIGFEISADQLPESRMPAIGASVIFQGTLSLKLNPFSADYKYQLSLTGVLVGEYEPYIPEIQVDLIKRTASKKLSRWFAPEALDSRATLLILCSKTAEDDIRKTLDNEGQDIENVMHVVYERLPFHPVDDQRIGPYPYA